VFANLTLFFKSIFDCLIYRLATPDLLNLKLGPFQVGHAVPFQTGEMWNTE